ncbi:hypothetical protein MSAN_02155200 [Mycena sanguinolenta]|uniref:Uncharacterized protein n=1 Tax=Mycena sanguinolenta TaxID=230812 RepID=A0A8H6XF68_9AGAR|nr:hypothetical protein MSAN_02155200 [Mycena sanguinolenta]
MSREEDRRPFSQVPEDSVTFADMDPFNPSYAPTLQEPFTLNPPYNPTDDNFFNDTYYSSDADTNMCIGAYMHALDWPHYQPMYAEDFNDVVDFECRYPLSAQFPELPLNPPFDLPATDDHAPFLFPAQFDPLLLDHSNQVFPHCEAQSHAFFQNHDRTDFQNVPEYFPEFFTDAEYCKEFFVPELSPTATNTFDEVDSPDCAAVPQRAANAAKVAGRTVRRSKPRLDRVSKLVASGFPRSDPETVSMHEKKRLYIQCLEQYIESLHQHCANLGIEPVPLERVSAYRGLTTHSMRTILIHLARYTHIIQYQTTQEQEKMIDLSIREVCSGAASCDIASPSSDTDSPGCSSAASTDADPDELDIMSSFLFDPYLS